MDFIGMTMVKNEEDIIEQFVRHNLTYFDKLYVFNHGSSDNTAEILQRLTAEGLPIVQVFNDTALYVGHAQASIMTSMFRLAVQDCGPAIYFPTDADEFLHSKLGKEELKREIENLPDTVVNIPNLSMAFLSETADSTFRDAPKSFNLMERWDVSVGKEVKVLLKITDPAIVDQLYLVQGNHGVLRNGVAMGKNKEFDGLRHIHVPVRSPAQAFRKFICGWLANVQSYGKDSRIATHWKQAFDLICEEGDEARHGLAYLLNSIYTGPVDLEKDFEVVDGNAIFRYELAYGHLRKKGMSVILRTIEADFDTLFKKFVQT